MNSIESDDRGLVLPCPQCGRRNRITYERLGQAFRCGQCQTELRAPGEPIELKNEAVFDALTAQDRPYKKAMSPEKALAVIEHEAGLGAWDHDVVAVLRRLVEKGEMMSSHRVVHDDVAFSPRRDAWR